MDITKYLEVIFQDQAVLYALIRKNERLSNGFDVTFEEVVQWETDWLEETKRRLEEADEAPDSTS